MKSTNSFVEQYSELCRENGKEPASPEVLEQALEKASDAFRAGGEGVKLESDRAGHRAPSHAQKKSPFEGC